MRTEMSAEYQTGAGRTGLQPHRQAGHRDHHGADPGPSRAAPDHRRADRDDEARLGDLRPRGLGRRKRGRFGRGRGGRKARRQDRRLFQNTATHLAADASALFARNLFNFLSAFWDKEAGKPVLDEEIGSADAA